jgi:omega-amidase
MKLKIGLVQYNPEWENKSENKRKISSLTKGINETDLLVFPEMTLTGFSMSAEKLSEEMQGDSFYFFSELSSKFSTNIFAGIIEKENGNYFNTLIHINSTGSLVNSYRKIHPFSYSDENKYYTPGIKPVITEVKGVKTGLSICYDLRFPELFRFYAKERVDLIINIANWPIVRIAHWKILLQARAVENQCYVAGVNRVGDSPNLKYNGVSSVFDPMGAEIISVENDEKILSVEIDVDTAKEIQTKFPFLNDIKLI